MRYIALTSKGKVVSQRVPVHFVRVGDSIVNAAEVRFERGLSGYIDGYAIFEREVGGMELFTGVVSPEVYVVAADTVSFQSGAIKFETGGISDDLFIPPQSAFITASFDYPMTAVSKSIAFVEPKVQPDYLHVPDSFDTKCPICGADVRPGDVLPRMTRMLR